MGAHSDRVIQTSMPRLLRFLPIVYAATLLGEAGKVWWMFELLSHWRIFYLVVGFFLLLLFGIIRKWRSFFIILMIVGVHLLRVAPYIVLNPPHAVKTDRELSIVFANTYWLTNDQGKLISSMKVLNPDIIIFFEILEPNFVKVRDALPDYKYSNYTSGMYAFNVGYLSKKPVKEDITYFIPLVPTLELQTNLAGQAVEILGAHPYSPVDNEFVQRRDVLLYDLFAYAAAQEEPLIFGGDLNISPFSPLYQDLRSQFPMLHDSLEEFGIQNSWPVHLLPPFFSIPIDHAWTNSKLKVLERKMGPNTGSDHLPLFVRVGV